MYARNTVSLCAFLPDLQLYLLIDKEKKYKMVASRK